MPSLTGNKPNQVPLNADLGNLAYQNASSIAGPVTVGGSVTANGVVSDTISEETSAAGVTVDGVLLKDSGVVTGAGTVSAPVYSTTGDTNTGVFFPAADTVAIAAGGVESARVVSGLLSIPANSTAASAVRLYEDTDNGTNYVDIIAPASLTADRTLTLPDNTGTILTTATAASSIPGYGSQILVADQWRLSTNTTVSGPGDTFITTNWERIDTDSPGTIGTAMSESSGVFAFPSTGRWLIQAIVSFDATAIALSYASGQIWITEDDSTYGSAATSVWGNKAVNEYTFSVNSFLFNVVSTTTHKMKLNVEVSANATLVGNSANTGTSILFLRLGS